MFSALFIVRANVIVEALNGCLKEMLSKVTANCNEGLNLYLHAVLFAY